jgi:hypothetical protein
MLSPRWRGGGPPPPLLGLGDEAGTVLSSEDDLIPPSDGSGMEVPVEN